MWLFDEKEVCSHEDLLPGCTDFVYMITYSNGKKYIGKKTVRSLRKLKPTKAQLKIRKNYVRKEMVDLPFVKYEGSHELADSLDIDVKEILYQCTTKKAGTYLEAALMFHHDVLFDDSYLNENISGVFFSNSLDGYIDPDNVMDLPVDYTHLSPANRRKTREAYIVQQKGLCCHCNKSVHGDPALHILGKPVDKSLFPEGFFNYPVHLHHDHNTGMTIGAVHAYCNAVLWQHYGE